MERIITDVLGKYDHSSIQALIFLLPSLFAREHSKKFETAWKFVKNILKTSGTLWILVTDPYLPLEKKKIPLSFRICKQLQEQEFYAKNIIICPRVNVKKGVLTQYYSNLLFMTLDPQDYMFNKDPIREKHIWKDHEWGGGRRSRYNPLGKDPSNIWITTKSEKGNILEYIPFTHQDIVERILRACTDQWNEGLIIKEKNIDLKFTGSKRGNHPGIISLQIEPSNSDIFSLKKPECKSNITNPNVKVFYHTCEAMTEITTSTVQCIVTSPPYWGLRDYNHPDQIGHDDEYIDYLNRLKKVWYECFRILKHSGTLWVNINKRIIQGNLLNIPNDLIEDITTQGFDLQDIIVWHKPIAVPGYGEKNLMDRWESILLFNKQGQNFFINTDYAISPPDYLEKSIKPAPNCWKFHRKIGNISKKIKVMINEREIKHAAIFPEELVNRVLNLSTLRGDTVVDPFAGSGTTLKQAIELGRSAIGYEINPDYKAIIDFRLKEANKSLLNYFSKA
ncbi:MAG: DNA methyltransferase [Candidatus Hodarchaeales archaeon]|jgi:site-specific DNA-methyltransferase (adenine-specific)